MPRLCERPGCSAVADVAYGFDRVARTVWLDRRDDDVNRAGALCRRHADAMVVPLGWVLDDRRDPVPRLFRAPGDATGAQRRPRRRTSAKGPVGDATVHQLRLDPPAVPAAPAVAHTHDASDPETQDAVVVEPDATSWIPRFDTADDVDGVLDARGPLLSRAFTGGRPTRPSR
jgi:hypothetical protein